MEDEDFLRRPPPQAPYAPSASVLDTPARAVVGTLALLRRAGRRESGLLWYGERDAKGNGQVRLVVAPPQRMHWGNYEIAAGAVADIVRRLPEAWRPLAQVHSHPGAWVEHSCYDDQMALSRRALSLVFPFYGSGPADTFPAGIGVHEHQEGYWHLLPQPLAAKRLRVTRGEVQVVDLR